MIKSAELNFENFSLSVDFQNLKYDIKEAKKATLSELIEFSVDESIRENVNTVHKPLTFPKQEIEYLTFAVTEKCENKCKFCYVPNTPKTLDMLEIEKSINTIKESEQGINLKHCTILGGDPLAVPEETIELIKYLKDLFPLLKVTIVTGFGGTIEQNYWFINEIIPMDFVSLTVNIDLPSSLRYWKAPYEYDEYVSMFNYSKSILSSSRVHVSTVISKNNIEFTKIREIIGNDTELQLLGQAYNSTADIDILERFKNECDKELLSVLNGDLTLDKSSFKNYKHKDSVLKNKACCNCGYSQLHVTKSGISICDTGPTGPKIGSFEYLPDVEYGNVSPECLSCSLLGYCGGRCGIYKKYEVHCILKIIRKTYSLYSRILVFISQGLSIDDIKGDLNEFFKEND